MNFSHELLRTNQNLYITNFLLELIWNNPELTLSWIYNELFWNNWSEANVLAMEALSFGSFRERNHSQVKQHHSTKFQTMNYREV